MLDWEATFAQWAQAPSATERTRCDNAVGIIKNAIDRHAVLGPKLRSHDIRVFVQGSYRNRVNVRADSDVDVGVLYTGSFFYKYPDGQGPGSLNIPPATYSYGAFKNDLFQALAEYLGSSMVTRGNKSIKLRETSYHVEADAAPFFEHRSYTTRYSYVPGVALRPDNGTNVVVNYPEALFSGWPKEHYENGHEKNQRTYRRYRGLVRVLKKLRNAMEENGHHAARSIPGYLLECLTWNAPDTCFDRDDWCARVGAVLAYLGAQISSGVGWQTWTEVDGFKLLFSSSQAWTPEQARDFVAGAWAWLGAGQS